MAGKASKPKAEAPVRVGDIVLWVDELRVGRAAVVLEIFGEQQANLIVFSFRGNIPQLNVRPGHDPGCYQRRD